MLDNLSDTANKRLVSAAIVEGVNAEGPVHVERLARAVAAAFETRRLTSARLADLTRMVPRSTTTTEDGTVLWPARTNPMLWTEFRGASDAEPRPTEHIPLREIGNAMVAVAAVRGPLTGPDLFALVRRLFGGKRVTANIEARYALALEQAIEQGRIRRSGELVELA